MPVLHLSYDEDLLVATGQTSAELEPELRFLLATKLYELGRVSAGQAARLAGIARFHFLAELGRRGFTVAHLGSDDVEDELRHDPPDVRQ